jgi:hypothetical protein
LPEGHGSDGCPYGQDRNDEPLNDWPVDQENRGYCEYQGNQDQTRGIHDNIEYQVVQRSIKYIARAVPARDRPFGDAGRDDAKPMVTRLREQKIRGTDQPRYVKYYRTGIIASEGGFRWLARGCSSLGAVPGSWSANFRAEFRFGFHLRSTPRQVYGWRD